MATKEELQTRLDNRLKARGQNIFTKLVPIDKGGVKVLTGGAEVSLAGSLLDSGPAGFSPADLIIDGNIGRGINAWKDQLFRKDLPYRGIGKWTAIGFAIKKLIFPNKNIQLGPFSAR